MIDQLQLNEKGKKVVYDRCPLDNIAYSMWCHDKGVKGFTKKFVTAQIALMKESMKHLDIIFLCRFDSKQAIDEEQSILDPNNLNELEALVRDQKAALEEEERQKELQKKFGLPPGGFPGITL